MNFGNKLGTLLEEQKLTQKELAMQLNVAPSTISSYVQNTREPDFETLKLIAQYFNVSTDYLLDYQINHSFNDQEEDLLQVFRSLSPNEKKICLEQCKAFIKINHS